MRRIFVDTNVLIDALANRQPFAADARAVWAEVETGRCRGFVAAVSLATVFYLVKKAADRATAWKAIEDIQSVFDIVACDAELIRSATTGGHDFEDDLQYQSAKRAKAEALITRNPADFPKRGVPILSPAAFLDQLE